jgi:hypothetical protein
MKRRDFVVQSVAAAGWLAGRRLVAQETAPPAGESYRPGERVDGEVFFLDAEQRPVTLASQVGEETRVLYLNIFGGAYAEKPPDKRGGLWCSDSVDDFSFQKSIYLNYADKGVTFVPVATPPVYGSERYGYPKEVFLVEPEDSPAYKKAVGEFIEKTEALKADGSVPFDVVFYDPRFRLLDNPREHRHVPAYGKVYPWQGRFKWREDQQRYGTPTIWLLDRELKVIREPFFGNVYEGVPLEIQYTVRDIVKALDQALGR